MLALQKHGRNTHGGRCGQQLGGGAYLQDPIAHTVSQPVDGKRLPLVPGILDDRAAADVVYLHTKEATGSVLPDPCAALTKLPEVARAVQAEGLQTATSRHKCPLMRLWPCDSWPARGGTSALQLLNFSPSKP